MAEYQNMTITVLQEKYPEPIKTPFMYRGIEDGVDYQKKRMPLENGGAITGATPDGRCCGETLADAGASPMRGRDVHGPLCTLRSAAMLPHDRYQAVLFNMKFTAEALKDDRDLDKLAAMIRTYFLQKGRQIQLNVVDEKELQDAKVHPENHEDLLVRVAGYSAYFVQLTDRLQDEILQRTANGIG